MEATVACASSIYGVILETVEQMENNFVIDLDDPNIDDILDVPDDKLKYDIDNPSDLIKQCDDTIQKLIYLRSVLVINDRVKQLYGELL